MNESQPFSWETTGPGHHRPIRVAEFLKEKPNTGKMLVLGFTTRKQRMSAMLYWITGGRRGSQLSPEYQEKLTRDLVVWWTCNVIAALDFYSGVGQYAKRLKNMVRR